MNNTGQKSESANYWEEHVLSWEAGAYYKEGWQNATWWDRLSTVFRGNAMYVRMNAALDLAAPHINGMSVLDVGCASGRFPFCLLQAGAGKVYGTDISAEAIQIAKEHGAELGLQNRLDFAVLDVVQPKSALPRVDLVTALGIIEYFNVQAMSVFLGNLRTKYILLDFPDLSRRREFPTWILRQVYIRVNRLPGVYLYSLDEFAKLAEPFGFRDLRLVKRNKFYYVTNLPE
jgi:cyclopropane fatty-acyl-phospholipid synthase-like methyltransferase